VRVPGRRQRSSGKQHTTNNNTFFSRSRGRQMSEGSMRSKSKKLIVLMLAAGLATFAYTSACADVI
jgi:hypothetical protein